MRKSIPTLIVLSACALILSCQTNGGELRSIRLYSTNFSSTAGWSTNTTSDTTRSFGSNNYSVQVISDYRFSWSLIPYGYGTHEGSIFPTYELEIKATLVRADDSGAGSVTIIFNYTDENNYDRLSISQYGNFRLAQTINGTENTPIINWTDYSPRFYAENLENTIRLVQYSNKLEIYGNGNLAAATNTVRGKNLASIIGIGVESYTNAATAQPKAVFTSVKLSNLR